MVSDRKTTVVGLCAGLRPYEDLQNVQTEWILYLQQVPGGMTPNGDILQEGSSWYPFKELVRNFTR
jgi:hypothetical protein